MKKIYILLLFTAVSFANEGNNIDTKKYDEIFNNLQNERKGVLKSEVYGVKNPFRMPVVEQNSTIALSGEVSPISFLTLTGIIENRAKINGVWYPLGSTISGYKIVKISNSGVILANNEDKQELKLTKGNKNVNIQIK